MSGYVQATAGEVTKAVNWVAFVVRLSAGCARERGGARHRAISRAAGRAGVGSAPRPAGAR
jgi:hypothetical protein